MRHLSVFLLASMIAPLFCRSATAGEPYLTVTLVNVQTLAVGVDDGSGFSFSTLRDDDGDGVIELPPVPVPGRRAVGVAPTADRLPGCDIWDFTSNVVRRASVPLLMNALANESVGVDYGELTVPQLALTPGQRFTITDGVFPGWPGIRLVDESGVAGLEEFVREFDRLPNFNGEVIVSETTAHFTPAPELHGDYNNDGKVDAADYVLWRKNEGTNNPLPNDLIGGEIGAAHYDQWRANFGNTETGSGEADYVAVPEPTSAVLLAVGLIAVGPMRRGPNRHLRAAFAGESPC